MTSFHTLLNDKHTLSAHVCTCCSLEDVLELSAASIQCRQFLQQGCKVARVCIVPPAYRDSSCVSSLVDAWYGTPFENDKEFHSFPTQGWSPLSLTAKNSLESGVWKRCCAAFISGSVKEFTTEARNCLRCILWLVEEIRLERILELRVPVTCAQDVGLAISQLHGPVTLGSACWEEKDIDRDWLGNSFAWWWGCHNHCEEKFSEDLVAQRPVDMSPTELRSPFIFLDEGGKSLLHSDLHPDVRREIFQALPRIEGLFEKNLTPLDLYCMSSAVRESVTRLGCLYISGSGALSQESDLASFEPFRLVEELSVEIKDFYCGSNAWPPHPSCRRNDRCAAVSAKKLSAFLASVFPAVRRISFFFQFPFGAAVPYPALGVTAMMRALISDFGIRMGRPIDVDVAILGIWEMDLDSLDNVDALCRPGWRRDGLLAAWADDDNGGLQGGFHLV